MNKVALQAIVAEETGVQKELVEKVFNSIISNIEKSLARDEDVKIVGFGSFVVRKRKGRMGKNPKTGEEITIPSSRKPGFKPGKRLIKALDEAGPTT